MRYLRVAPANARLFNRIQSRRNALARAVREAGGLFRERAKLPSARRYRRRPKHRLRSLHELMLQ